MKTQQIEEIESETKFVSIRCRRHKRRFDVPEAWVKSTSYWLCPHCYEKLSREERKKYEPTEKTEIRPPEGRRICLPSGWGKKDKADETVEIVNRQEAVPKVGSDEDKTTFPASDPQGDSEFRRKLDALVKRYQAEDQVKKGSIRFACIHCNKEVEVSKGRYFADPNFCDECRRLYTHSYRWKFQKHFMDCYPDKYKERQQRLADLLAEENQNERQAETRSEEVKVLPVVKKEDREKKVEVPRYDGIPAICKKPVSAPTLSDLLPQFRIYCHKCKQEMPCHKSWFDQSTTLCPTCFSSMGSLEREVFEKAYKGQARRVSPMSLSPIASSYFRITNQNPYANVDRIKVERGINESTIMKMPINELKQAVKRGFISKTRARMELKRRRNREYYSGLPEQLGIPLKVWS